MEYILSGFVLGFFTSFHCVGMCGPIALALPLRGKGKMIRTFGGILYNLGRTTTYMVFGIIFGVLGQGFGALGFQRWVSISAGLLMILSVFVPSLFNKNFSSNKLLYSLLNKIKSTLARLFSAKSFGSLFSIGLINGLLPCGPLYIAFIASTGTGNVISAAMFMLMFGLGTIPILFLVTLIGNFISIPIRQKINSLLPILIVLIGVLFILRGLNLGIPYLSPKEEMIKKKVERKLDLQQSISKSP